MFHSDVTELNVTENPHLKTASRGNSCLPVKIGLPSPLVCNTRPSMLASHLVVSTPCLFLRPRDETKRAVRRFSNLMGIPLVEMK